MIDKLLNFFKPKPPYDDEHLRSILLDYLDCPSNSADLMRLDTERFGDAEDVILDAIAVSTDDSQDFFNRTQQLDYVSQCKSMLRDKTDWIVIQDALKKLRSSWE